MAPHAGEVLAAARLRRGLPRGTLLAIRRRLRASGMGRVRAWRATRRLQRELRTPASADALAVSNDIVTAVGDALTGVLLAR